jgi:hypothetical protein
MVFFVFPFVELNKCNTYNYLNSQILYGCLKKTSAAQKISQNLTSTQKPILKDFFPIY